MDEYLKMYEGIPFSPVATLTQPVNEADTIIHVSDSGVFPEGPNYATIGSDENAETVFYAQKASGLLSGCTRGVEGIARAWQAEEVIARNFTGLDYRALHKNMDKAISELSGKANTVNGKTPDAQGNITLTAADIAVEAVAGMQAENVQEAIPELLRRSILTKDAAMVSKIVIGGGV